MGQEAVWTRKGSLYWCGGGENWRGGLYWWGKNGFYEGFRTGGERGKCAVGIVCSGGSVPMPWVWSVLGGCALSIGL